MNRTIMHVDMNAFFASVEQQCNPQLRGRPVAVIGSHKRTIITTASYQARSFGLKTGMTPGEAKKRCPQLILVTANNDKYIHTCAVLACLFMQYTPQVEVFSIDEAFLDLTGSLTLFPSPEHIAGLIKDEIREKLGLGCSIGIAPNKLLAKLASGLKKPDGLVVIPPEKVSTLLENLPVQELWGIGPHLAGALADRGIKTCGELGRTSAAMLREEFGVLGALLPSLGMGIDNSPVVPQGKGPLQRSVSHALTFPADVSDRKVMKRHLLQLSEMVGRRLRCSALQGRTVILTVRYSDFTTFTRSLTAGACFDEGMTIYHTAVLLLNTISLLQKVRLLGVTVNNLSTRSSQLPLFPHELKRAAITRVMDSINDRYGEYTISRGTLHEHFFADPDKAGAHPSQHSI